jgi:hypothetical protein
MNLNGNLRKGQCQPALRLMQNTENDIPEQNPAPAPKGDLISFDENPASQHPPC